MEGLQEIRTILASQQKKEHLKFCKKDLDSALNVSQPIMREACLRVEDKLEDDSSSGLWLVPFIIQEKKRRLPILFTPQVRRYVLDLLGDFFDQVRWGRVASSHLWCGVDSIMRPQWWARRGEARATELSDWCGGGWCRIM